MDSLHKVINAPVWERSLSNEWGRLARGNDAGVKGTETVDFIFFIKYHLIEMSRMLHLYVISNL